MIKYFLVLSLVLAGPVLAEETSVVEAPDEVQQAIEEAAKEALVEEQKSEEVKIDTEIKAEDLGVREARVLPGSFFYGFKNFVRGIQEATARDPVKKAELQLKHANEMMVEAKQLVEKDGSDKAAEIAAGVIKGINENFEKIAQQSENLKKAKIKDSTRVEKFLDKVADQSLKQQVVLQRIQEQVPEKVFARIEQSRQEHLEKFGQVMTNVAENPEDMARRLPQIIENREGSDFKELKAMEILRDLEDKVPEEAKEALRQAQSALSQKFEQRFAAIPPEVRKEKLQNYVESLPGNAVRQFEAFDRMKESFQSEGMAKEMELAKDKAFQKFENQFSQFEGEEARQAFMQPWREGSPESLRTITEMEMRMESPQDDPNAPPVPVFQNFQQFKQEAQNNFKERFGGNPEQLRQNQVFQRMENQPNVVDLKMSRDLVKIFESSEREPIQGMPSEGTPSALNFMRDFQNQATDKFIENVSSQAAGQGSSMFGPPVPGGLKVLEEIKNQVPFHSRQGINRAIEAQTQTIERHLEQIEDPAVFEKYKQQIEGDRSIKRQVEIIRQQPQEGSSSGGAPQRPNVPLTPERQQLFEKKPIEPSSNFQQQFQPKPEFQSAPQPQQFQPSPAPSPAPPPPSEP